MSVHFMSQRMDWKTPKAVYQVLDAEFSFDYDPCPPKYEVDGLTSDWGARTMLIRPTVVNYPSLSLKATRSGRKVRLSCS